MRTYSDYKNRASSEKITLAILSGSRRVIVWTQLSEKVFYKSSSSFSVIEKFAINGITYSKVNSFEELDENTFFHDINSQQFYIFHENPNDFDTHCILTEKYFFSSKALSLPFDLKDGHEVYFEPMLDSTSDFSAEFDIVNDSFSAIEGDGTLILLNDHDFWKDRYDSITFDNQFCSIYSYTSELPSSEARLMYRGLIESKSYESDKIRFKLKDLLYSLRSNIILPKIADLGFRNKTTYDNALQRLVYGQVFGHKPVNLDALIDNAYPIQGAISIKSGSNIVIGSVTRFKKHVLPGDKLVLKDTSLTVADVLSDSALVVTTNYTGADISGASYSVTPASSRSYFNRIWHLGGHQMSEPIKFLEQGSTTQRLFLSDTIDIFAGDDLWIGDDTKGELISVLKVVNGKIVTLVRSTQFIYSNGTPVKRICVQNLRMNDLELVYSRDYVVDSAAGLLYLNENAEDNIAPVLESGDYINCVTGNDFFTGNGTLFTSYLKVGDKVGPKGGEKFYTILNLTDDHIKLAEPYTGFTYTSNDPLPEITSISGLDEMKALYKIEVNNTDLRGKFIRLYDSDGSVALWFDIGNVGTVEPEHNCDSSIKVTAIDLRDNEVTRAHKIAQRLNRESERFIAWVQGATVYVRNFSFGVLPAARRATADGIETLTLSRTKQYIRFIADVGDSLDHKGFFLHGSSDTFFVWYATDNNLNPDPPIPAGVTSLRVGSVNTDDSAAVIATKTAAVLATHGFSITYQSAEEIVVTSGSLITASNGTTAFVVSTDSYGKSAYSLIGKYIIIPRFDAVSLSTKKILFWFDVIGFGGVAPVVIADELVKVELESSDDESDVFDAIEQVGNDLGYWEIESTDTSLTFTDKNRRTLSSSASAGNSGFTITTIQKGLSDNPKSGRLLQYKSFIFDDSSDILTCDIYGKTDDGLTTGNLMRTAPEIVKDLCSLAGLGSYIDHDSFASASDDIDFPVNLVIPDESSGKSAGTYKDSINELNRSCFGLLYQSQGYRLCYNEIKPQANSATGLLLDKTDIVSIGIDNSSSEIVYSVTVEFDNRECRYDIRQSYNGEVTKTNDAVAFLANKSGSKTIKSRLISELHAQMLASRWSFLLEQSSNVFNIETKLQAIDTQVGDIINVSHEKLPNRFGGGDEYRLLLVQSVGKSALGVSIHAIDLSNVMNRVAKFSEVETEWSKSSAATRLGAGFYSDDNGLIENDERSFYSNRYW